MSKDVKILLVVVLACLGGACFAETENNEDMLAYAAPRQIRWTSQSMPLQALLKVRSMPSPMSPKVR
jgi:hypothetical protein